MSSVIGNVVYSVYHITNSGSDWIGPVIYVSLCVLSTLGVIYFAYLTVRLSKRKAIVDEQEKNEKLDHEHLESS